MSRDEFLHVRRTARLSVLGDPGPSVRQVWIACHGYAQLATRFVRRFESLDDGSRLIVAPEALNRFYIESEPGPHGPDSRVGATWMTREDRLNDIEDCIAYLDAVHSHVFAATPRSAVKLVVLGFSQGMSTVARWAERTESRVDRLVLWSGSWPPELQPRRDMFGGARVTLVAGRSDPSVSEAAVDRLVRHLASGGIDAEILRFDGGHELDAGTLAEIAAGTGPS